MGEVLNRTPRKLCAGVGPAPTGDASWVYGISASFISPGLGSQRRCRSGALLAPSCGTGVCPGQWNLAWSYSASVGVDKDDTEAFRWCRKAAEQNFKQAQHALGRYYAEGRGVEQDYVAAYLWYTRAIATGSDEAETDRKKLSAKMTPAQLAEAKRLVTSKDGEGNEDKPP